MASSFAKELCLSPILNTSSMRRRSLEICQQLGTQLLSPNLLQQLSPSLSPPNSQSPSSLTSSPNSSNKSSTSPFKLVDHKKPISPVFKFGVGQNEAPTCAPTYHNRRRASDSVWMVESLQEVKNRRREPHSPQHPRSSFNKPCNKERWESEEKSEKVKQDESKQECGDSESRQAGTNRDDGKGNVVTCNIIPPTPLKTVGQVHKKMPPLQCSLDISSSESEENGEEEKDETDPEIKWKLDQMRGQGIYQLGWNCEPLQSFKKCSGGAKYDLDDNLIKFVSLRWNLSLNPDELLGKGSFGTVIGGMYKGKEVAVKILKTTNAQRRASIIGEDNALNLPYHNHIARTMDIFHIGPDRELVIMEKMHKGNLLTLLNDPSFEMNCSIAINICKQIALGLIFCHRQGVLHLDVKPQNILVDSRNCCKLSDFGSSKKISDLESCYKHTTLEGTVPYTAPELFKGDRPTEKCDVYSFAITMWQVLTREVPYEDENEHTVIFRVVSQGLRPGNNNEPNCSGNETEMKLVVQFTHLYEQAWDADPGLRPTMIEVHKSLIEIQFFSSCVK